MKDRRYLWITALGLDFWGWVTACAGTGDMMGKDEMMAKEDTMAKDEAMSKAGMMDKQMGMASEDKGGMGMDLMWRSAGPFMARRRCKAAPWIAVLRGGSRFGMPLPCGKRKASVLCGERRFFPAVALLWVAPLRFPPQQADVHAIPWPDLHTFP